MSASCYCQIHLLRFIICYCNLIYNEYVISVCFIINCQKTLLILQIIITNTCFSQKIRIYCFCDIFRGHCFAADNEYFTLSKALGLYRGSGDRVRYFHNRKVLVYNIFSVNNTYSYGELSIFVLFFYCEILMLMQYVLFLVFFRLKFHISIFPTNSKYGLFCSFQSQYFESIKEYHKVCIEIQKQRTTLRLLFVDHQVRYNTLGPAGSNLGNLGSVPAPVARGCHGLHNTLLLAL